MSKGKSKNFLQVGLYYRVFLDVITQLAQLSYVRQIA